MAKDDRNAGKNTEGAPTRSKGLELAELSDADKVRLFDRMLANTPGLANTLGRGGGKAGGYQEGRRSLAYELYDRGLLNEQRLALEILYLLPDGFVNFYSELFHRALRGAGSESVMHGRSGGLDKAKGLRGGMALGSDARLQASGTGKKYKNTPMFVGNEKALRVKNQLDQGLGELVSAARDQLELMDRDPGDFEGGTRSPACPTCHRFAKSNWAFCPTDGTLLTRPQGSTTQTP